MLACLLARLCGCFAVVAGGLEKTTSLQNGKGRKLFFAWAGQVRNDESSLHSFNHSPFTRSRESLDGAQAGRQVLSSGRQRAGAIDGAVVQ